MQTSVGVQGGRCRLKLIQLAFGRDIFTDSVGENTARAIHELAGSTESTRMTSRIRLWQTGMFLIGTPKDTRATRQTRGVIILVAGLADKASSTARGAASADSIGEAGAGGDLVVGALATDTAVFAFPWQSELGESVWSWNLSLVGVPASA